MTRDVVAPHDTEAEVAVIGAMLLDPAACAVTFKIVGPQDFYRGPHATVAEAIQALYSRSEPTDVVAVKHELEERGAFSDVGGAAFLSRAMSSTPTSANAEHYARIILDAAQRRRVIRLGGELDTIARNGSFSSDAALGACLEALTEAQRRTSTRQTTMPELVTEFYERMDAGRAGALRTGFTIFDAEFGGIPAHGLTILAARPSSGKTSLALQIALQVATRGAGTVMLFSVETPRVNCARSLLSQKSRVPLTRLRGRQGTLLTDEESERLSEAAAAVAEANLLVDDTATISPLDIRARVAGQRALGNDVALVVVDYLQLLDTTPVLKRAGTREQEVAWLMRTLKVMCQATSVPMLVLAQLNRATVARKDKRPQLSDLRESGSVEQDADCVLFVHRPEALTTDPEEQLAVRGQAEIIVAKYREEKTGALEFRFDAPCVRFEEAPQPLSMDAWDRKRSHDHDDGVDFGDLM